jgi:hypothetical protein
MKKVFITGITGGYWFTWYVDNYYSEVLEGSTLKGCTYIKKMKNLGYLPKIYLKKGLELTVS